MAPDHYRMCHKGVLCFPFEKCCAIIRTYSAGDTSLLTTLHIITRNKQNYMTDKELKKLKDDLWHSVANKYGQPVLDLDFPTLCRYSL